MLREPQLQCADHRTGGVLDEVRKTVVRHGLVPVAQHLRGFSRRAFHSLLSCHDSVFSVEQVHSRHDSRWADRPAVRRSGRRLRANPSLFPPARLLTIMIRYRIKKRRCPECAVQPHAPAHRPLGHGNRRRLVAKSTVTQFMSESDAAAARVEATYHKVTWRLMS